MTVEDALIDRIVKDVMRHLETSSDGTSSSSSPQSSRETVTCSKKVVTRELLEEICIEGSQLLLGESSLLTPSARDFVNEKGIVFSRGSLPTTKTPQASWNVVLHEPFAHLLQRLNDFDVEVRTSSCFEESLTAFRQSLAQNETGAVFIVENPEVVVCKANREKTIRACQITDASRLETVWKQLKPNLVCLSPESFSNFELKSLIRKIVSLDSSSTARATR